MILLGKNITSPSDNLQPFEVEKVYKAILNSTGEVAVLQNRLQTLKLIDENQYRKLKTRLPYLVCAVFHPRVRKKENFLYTERFFIDIDHLSHFNLNINNVKEFLKKDSRVELLFTSPGGDGLKLLFKLSSKINDSAYYSHFYESFCLSFSLEHNLNGAIDFKTKDVSRCCFVSHDPEAYYNPQAEAVDYNLFLPDSGFEALDKLKELVKNETKSSKADKAEWGIPEKSENDLPDDIINRIKSKMGMRTINPNVKKNYIQPEELEIVILEMTEFLKEIEAEIIKMTAIDYGRQIRIGNTKVWCEVNIFYGKKGVRVVGTTKSGSNKELCDNMVKYLQSNFETF